MRLKLRPGWNTPVGTYALSTTLGTSHNAAHSSSSHPGPFFPAHNESPRAALTAAHSPCQNRQRWNMVRLANSKPLNTPRLESLVKSNTFITEPAIPRNTPYAPTANILPKPSRGKTLPNPQVWPALLFYSVSRIYKFSMSQFPITNMADSLVNRDGAEKHIRPPSARILIFPLRSHLSELLFIKSYRKVLLPLYFQVDPQRSDWLIRLMALDTQTIIAFVALAISIPPTLAVLITWLRSLGDGLLLLIKMVYLFIPFVPDILQLTILRFPRWEFSWNCA